MPEFEMAGVLLVGLTGGIASGKSAVSARLRDLGIAVVDTDAVTHELLADGEGPVAARVAAAFPEALTPEGVIDRGALGRLVFGDAGRLARLEGILHPAIGAVVGRRVRELARSTSLVVLEVPLLFEAGWDRLVDLVVVVDAQPSQQVERFCRRTGSGPHQALARMASQTEREHRIARADRVLTNHGSMEELLSQVDGLAAFLREEENRHER